MAGCTASHRANRFEEQAWEDYTSWLKTDRKMLARINKLIEDIRRDPFSGIGKPESLKYHLPGAWSRRIDDEHRLVYIVTEAEIAVTACPAAMFLAAFTSALPAYPQVDADGAACLARTRVVEYRARARGAAGTR